MNCLAERGARSLTLPARGRGTQRTSPRPHSCVERTEKRARCLPLLGHALAVFATAFFSPRLRLNACHIHSGHPALPHLYRRDHQHLFYCTRKIRASMCSNAFEIVRTRNFDVAMRKNQVPELPARHGAVRRLARWDVARARRRDIAGTPCGGISDRSGFRGVWICSSK